MLVPKLTKITKEELQEAPGWVVRLITPINLFFQQTWNCLQNLTIGQNVIGRFINVQITTLATYAAGDFTQTDVQWGFKKNVEGVMVTNTRLVSGNLVVNTQAITCDWVQTATGIRILYIAGLQPSTRYNVTLLAL